MRVISFLLICIYSFTQIMGQENTNQNKFRQLGQELATPNNYRDASGAPGPDYWQQQVDYKMDLEIDNDQQRLYGDEEIRYQNNSPNTLKYLWVQLDQNVRAEDSQSHMIRQQGFPESPTVRDLSSYTSNFDGGFKIIHVKHNDRELAHTINKTMMRVELPEPLKPGRDFTFNIKWWYNINNTAEVRGRSGYEHFAEDDNNVYVIAQFFPRLAKYYDVYGWQNKQFLGRGEFTLEFGNYEVNITVPSDHLVAATGTLQNENVLPADIKRRFNEAKREFDQPVIIASKEEANERMKSKATTKKTWKYKAENVRDFGFASSRRFIWDGMNTRLPSGKTAMSMSMYVKEGDCLWSKYSTKAVAQSLKTYSKYTIEYPYPVAWSIDGSMGMEYPMICFNYGRCEEDGTYSERMKYGHIGVIIHEVGHNFFPMIINSDERQWTWMDEGLNTYVQYLTEQEFERNFPSRRGPAHLITDYMKGDKSNISPIMTNSESIHQFGPNAYGKPATALNILRETIVGRELFDYAFREYSERWKFKTPTPSDFFRSIEDASAVDLDWFWRGWFYTTDHVDLAITDMKATKLDPINPDEKYDMVKKDREKAPRFIGDIRNEKEIKQTYNEADPTLNDFYTDYDSQKPNALDLQEYQSFMDGLSDSEKETLSKGDYYYELTFENIGGLPMPVIFEFEYKDGTTEVVRIPAEIWKMDDATVTKVFARAKEVVKVTLDPFLETADVDTSNNYYPKKSQPDRFEVFKNRTLQTQENPMQRDRRAKEIKP